MRLRSNNRGAGLHISRVVAAGVRQSGGCGCAGSRGGRGCDRGTIAVEARLPQREEEAATSTFGVAEAATMALRRLRLAATAAGGSDNKAMAEGWAVTMASETWETTVVAPSCSSNRQMRVIKDAASRGRGHRRGSDEQWLCVGSCDSGSLMDLRKRKQGAIGAAAAKEAGDNSEKQRRMQGRKWVGYDNDRGMIVAHDQQPGTCNSVPFLLEMPVARREGTTAQQSTIDEEDNRDGNDKGVATRLGVSGEEGINIHVTRETMAAGDRWAMRAGSNGVLRRRLVREQGKEEGSNDKRVEQGAIGATTARATEWEDDGSVGC
ncbi:hypothetical protein BHE74_00045090 [Ensete ventricosum]|nr:hypothetical protein BHE74_00045090 [Ensete ventricosum]RZS05042.1 hypothetical protein BHM03_00035471 [Ensete ventricosum]